MPTLAAAVLYLVAGPEPAPDARPAYPAAVVRVIDGDTFEADLSLGLGVSRRVVVRLADVDAPEARGRSRAEGMRAAGVAARLLARGPVVVRPVASDPFGRVVAEVWAGGVDLDAALRSAGLDTGRRW